MAALESVKEERLGYPSGGRALLILVLLVLAYIVSFVDRQVLSLLVDPIKANLGISDFQMSLLQGLAFAIFFPFLSIPCGYLADRHSRKWIIAGGIFLWSLMTVGCGLAGSFVMLFIARMGVGVGEASLAPAGFSILADIYRKDRLVWATSIFSMGSLLGGALAFLIGGAVINFFQSDAGAAFRALGLQSWQLTFIAIALPGFLVAALFLFIQEPSRKDADQGAPPSLLGAAAYVWARRRVYLPLYFTAMLMATLTYAGLSWFPAHVMRTFGLSPGRAGLLLGLVHMAGPIVGTVLGAWLTSRFQRQGHTDATLRTVIIVALAGALSFIAPLMPTLEITAVVWFASVIFQSAYYGSISAAMQIITPNQLRATNLAFSTIVVSIGGLGGGLALIGGIADVFFAGNPRGIGYALAIVGSSAGLLAAVVAAYGRAPLREAMARIEQGT